MTNRTWQVFFVVLVTVIVSGCASHYFDRSVWAPYGIIFGFWHGLIAPLAFVVDILSWIVGLFGIEVFSELAIIGQPNTGFFFYYLSFGLGLMVWLFLFVVVVEEQSY